MSNMRRPFAGRPPRDSHASEWLEDGDEPFEQDPPKSLSPDPASNAHSASPASAAAHSAMLPGSDEGYTRSRGAYRAQGARDTSDKPKRSLRGRALGYLSRREHSRSELARKLAPFVDERDAEDAVAQLLDALDREGWLSDSRFAESVVNRRASRFGASRIVGELKRHGVDSDLVQTLGASLRDTEWERICQVWNRKFGRLAETQQERAKQARFLASRGFSRDAIMRVLKLGSDELPDGD